MDLSVVKSRDDVGNLNEAFDLAEKHLSVPRLLEPEGQLAKPTRLILRLEKTDSTLSKVVGSHPVEKCSMMLSDAE